jgi:hypothetical protein
MASIRAQPSDAQIVPGYGTTNTNNEIVMAVRQHAGKLPVYAYLEGEPKNATAVWVCFMIEAQKQVPTGMKITQSGQILYA